MARTFPELREPDGRASLTDDGRCAITGVDAGHCECYEYDPDSPACPRDGHLDAFREYVEAARRRPTSSFYAGA